MNIQRSPMLRHALESFEHSLEHFLDGTERSRKFALLHVDQAIELLLKEKVVCLGKSIYKSDGTTLTLHETFSSLKNLTLPERSRLEELHDLRNTVQHKGLTPDPDTTQFYIQIAYDFVKRFLEDELSTPIDKVLSRQFRALMEGAPDPAPAPTPVTAMLQEARTASTPAESILKAYTALSIAAKHLGSGTVQPMLRRALRAAAEDRGIPGGPFKALLDDVFALRGRVVHSDYEPTVEDARNFLDSVVAILTMSGLKPD